MLGFGPYAFRLRFSQKALYAQLGPRALVPEREAGGETHIPRTRGAGGIWLQGSFATNPFLFFRDKIEKVMLPFET